MTDNNRPRIDAYRGIGRPAPTTVDGVIAELEVFEMLRRIHNADVAPGQVNVSLADPAYAIAKGNFGHDGAHFARILADEIARLRAENTELETRRKDLFRRLGEHMDDLGDARSENLPLRALVLDLFQDSPCAFDHHGYCQEHGWFETEPACPHSRIRALGLDQDGRGQANG